MRHRIAALLVAAAVAAMPPPAGAQDPPPAGPGVPVGAPTAPAFERPSWGWVLVMAGAAALAVSATFALRASANHADWRAARDPGDKARLKERGESRALAADVTGAAGLLTAAAGALVVWRF